MNNYVFENVKDFDPVHVFECGQCFRWVPEGKPDVSASSEAAETADACSSGCVYTGAAGRYAARVTFLGGTLRIEATGGDREFWRRYFDLDTDYGEIKEKLVRSEPAIDAAVRYGGGIRILRQDLFETIISFIISQNNNIPRIRKNIESICARYGEYIGEAFGREWYAFPEPRALADADIDELNAMKLGYRSSYIKAAGRRFLELPAPSCREDVLEYLGIGPKVANCIMLFGLRCTEAFPIDTWVRHIMNDMYGFSESDTRGMAAFAEEKFAELAGYAQQYLFYYYRDRK